MGSKIAKIVLGIIFLAVFNVLFFIIRGTENPSSVWISYGFIQAAYFFLLITPLFNKGNRRLTVLSMDLYSISASYFIVELIVGLVFMNTEQTDGDTWALLVQVILFALYLLSFLSSFLANASTRQSVETSCYESMYIKEAALQLQVLLRQGSDKNVSRKLEKCYDLLQASPIQSHAQVRSLETSIRDMVERLKTTVADGEPIEKIDELCCSIRLKLDERNIALKLLRNN